MKMSLREFVRVYRPEIDRIITNENPEIETLDNKLRRKWVKKCDRLRRWALIAGVREVA